METNDTTIYGTADQFQKKENKNTPQSWKAVTVGGMTGILIGAGAMYGTEALAGGENATENSDDAATTEAAQRELTVVEVNQDLPFGEAFAAARQEAGADGVFAWRGGVYGTCTESEWNAMTTAEHQQFTRQALQEVTPTPWEDAPQTVYHHVVDDSHHAAPDHHTAQTEQPHHAQQTSSAADNEQHNHHQTVHTTAGEAAGADSQEPEVHFLGVGRIQGDDGSVMNVGRMSVNGEDVALIDIDDNEVFDVMVSDRNHNSQIDEDEVIDISAQGLSVREFAMMSEVENEAASVSPADMAASTQEHIADDMPDYMNDADVQTI